MRYIEQNIDSENLCELLENYFQSVEIVESDNDLIKATDNSRVLNSVIMDKSKTNIIGIEINTISPEQVIKEELDNEVIELNRKKNNLFLDITGKTVNQRKQEMRNDVLPTDVKSITQI
jgi:hypothetical protein